MEENQVNSQQSEYVPSQTDLIWATLTSCNKSNGFYDICNLIEGKFDLNLHAAKITLH